MKIKKRYLVLIVLSSFFLLNLCISLFPNIDIGLLGEAEAKELVNDRHGCCDECDGEPGQVRILCWDLPNSTCNEMDCTVHAGDCWGL